MLAEPELPGLGRGLAELGGGAGGTTLEPLLLDFESFLVELESELFLLS